VGQKRQGAAKFFKPLSLRPIFYGDDPSFWTTNTPASFFEDEALTRKTPFFLSDGTGLCLGIRKVIGHALVPTVAGVCSVTVSDVDTKSAGLCSASPTVELPRANYLRTELSTALRGCDAVSLRPAA
jgi:hypothetical protein